MQQSYPRKKQTQIKSQSNNTSIEWILNLIDTFPKYELSQYNMKRITQIQLERIQQSDKLSEGKMYSYDQSQQKFTLTNFILYSNILVQLDEQDYNLDQAQFLILSTCTLEKKTISYKEFQAQGLILSNQIGQTYLFFDSHFSLVQWHKHMKKFCKLTNFQNKFTIKERQNVPNVFACVKNKNNKVYTVQIFRQQDLLKNGAMYEALMNEISILMTFKHPSLLNYFAIYEDQQHLYILYEYWVGDPLYKLIIQGLKLNSSQIASIIYQIVKLIRFLHQNQLYHCAITPQNIIILRNHVPNAKNQNQYKTVLISFMYREENHFNFQWLLKRLVKQWIPPELVDRLQQQQDQTPIDPFKIDTYQIGCTLYYMFEYKSNIPKHTIPMFNKTLDQFHISFDELDQLKKQQQEDYSNGGPLTSMDGYIFSQSQFDLMTRLLDPNPSSRLDIYQAATHHWFINEKLKGGTIVQKFPKILPSLKTILELRESSSQDFNSKQDAFDEDDEEFSIFSEEEKEEEEMAIQNDIDKVQDERCHVYRFLHHLNKINKQKHPSKFSYYRIINKCRNQKT